MAFGRKRANAGFAGAHGPRRRASISRHEPRLALASPPGGIATPLRTAPQPPGAEGPSRRPKLRKLRFALVLLGLAMLAFVSWIFGIMMAVAQDLPQLEDRAQYARAQNSVVTDIDHERIATLTNNEGRILIPSDDIAPAMKQAVVAIEDQRFYEHRGVDFQGIARAVVADLISRSAEQGASTITQQFVKNALEAQDSRTIFQKLRESALAYHLERQWSKDKILTEYLNSIYFGEGAYGIEAAARTYFGYAHPECGGADSPCARELFPWEAAMLAGLISSPTAYSPRSNYEEALTRRNLVLQKMVEQGYITPEEYEEYSQEELPAPSQIRTPEEESAAPYFTSWLRQQLVDKYGAGEAFGGGLEVASTLDLDLQQQAEQIVSSRLGGLGPTAAVVVLDNATAGVRAMVGGFDYEREPFNLATQGARQPGSAFKPFTLVTALEEGHSPSEVYASKPKTFTFQAPGYKEPQKFVVHNYNDSYLGSASITSATTYSDNSVYAELGLNVGTEDIAETAHEMGIESDLSTNPAMILGGFEGGVTPLEMAHAYVTLAHDGQRVSGSMASHKDGPVAILKVTDADGDLVEANDGESGENKVELEEAVSQETARTAISILETVVSQGTGTNAAIGDFAWGKTGTTEDNGDAWFVGATDEVTIAVWVGYRDSNKPMETEFGGAPVDGGTIPALIWNDVATAYQQLALSDESELDDSTTVPPPVTTTAVPTTTTTVAPEPAPEEPAPEEPSTPATEPGGSGGGGSGGGSDGSGSTGGTG